MGNNDTEATSKPLKVPPQQDQLVIPAYPDWSAMQAYYGPGVGIPPPYFTSAVVPGHAPHQYVWGPQPMMPFGTTYPAIYAPGAYPHHSLTLGPHTRSQGNTSTSEAVNAVVGTENHAKPLASSKDCGLMKKLKGFDGLVVSTSNGNHEYRGDSVNSQSESEDLDGSSNGSEGNSEGSPLHKKRSRSSDMPLKGKKGKEGTELNIEVVSPTVSLGVAGTPSSIIGKMVAAPAALAKPEMDLGISGFTKPKPVAHLPQPSASLLPIRDMPSDHWIQNTCQDERELKRERRKQSNRESARRSRLRKQAETEELALKVENLTSEKANLQSEISRLSEMSEKLRRENSILMEKLKVIEGGESGASLDETDSKTFVFIGCKNLLSRLDNSNSTNMDGQQEHETYEISGMKLHQLLEPNPQAGSVSTS